MTYTKKLAKNGSLTIPRQLRHELGLHPGSPVNLATTADGALAISKYVPVCRICGEVDDVATIKNTTLCKGCHAQLEEAFDNGG